MLFLLFGSFEFACSRAIYKRFLSSTKKKSNFDVTKFRKMQNLLGKLAISCGLRVE